ncbi:MAG: hypothetical protein NVS4B12_20340 [Ktedonobacteraceae bacterium]
MIVVQTYFFRFLSHMPENDNYLNFAERSVVLQEHKAEGHAHFIV